MREVIVGTAGHIDHGKTTLVRTLTGIDTDRLEEEKRRGITIDIGFAHWESDEIRFGFIDVPGHERFVKNMLCGVGGIDLVMLVVAADESVMPQTVEHFNICRLLGIERGIAVLTKKNHIEAELLELVEEEVRDLGAGTFLADAPVIPVDSLSGEGIDDVREALRKAVGPVRRRFGYRPAEDFAFRLPVDRVFSIRGFGTVVTGTPTTGQTRLDDSLQPYPGKSKSKVRGIEIFNRKSDVAAAGQRTALNLSGIEKSELERGVILAAPAAECLSFLLDAEVALLEGAPSPLPHRAPIRVHHGSAELIGRLHLLDSKQLAPGESALAQIRLDTEAACLVGDRFVIRRYSPMETIGGGRVLDPKPSKHTGRKRREISRQLGELSAGLRREDSESLEAYLLYALRRSETRGIDVNALSARTGLLPDRVESILDSMDGVRTFGQSPRLALAMTELETACEAVRTFLGRHHDESPLSSGVPAEELRRRAVPGASEVCFQFVLSEMSSRGEIVSSGGRVRLEGREAALSKEQLEIRDRLLGMMEESGLNPPSLEQLCGELPYSADEVRGVFYYLLDRSHLVRVSNQIVLSADGLSQIRRRLEENFPKGTAFSVAQFRDLFGISRKFAIPYLEYLDSTRVTQRMGDERILR